MIAWILTSALIFGGIPCAVSFVLQRFLDRQMRRDAAEHHLASPRTDR